LNGCAPCAHGFSALGYDSAASEGEGRLLHLIPERGRIIPGKDVERYLCGARNAVFRVR
jgi:hypothetical protein